MKCRVKRFELAFSSDQNLVPQKLLCIVEYEMSELKFLLHKALL